MEPFEPLETNEPDTDADLESLIADQLKTGAQPSAQAYYAKPLASKSQAQDFPSSGHALLSSSKAQDTFQRFGLDGLKTLVLQELVQLDFEDLQREVFELAKIQQPEVRRLLRAVKLMAAQWMEDSRQPTEVQLRCTALFEWIPTFKTSPLPPPPKTFEDDLVTLSFDEPTLDLPPAIPRRPAVAQEPIPDRIVLITDVQGDGSRLQRLLQRHRLASTDGGHWTWTGGDAHLVLVGDILNGSPFSAWRHRIGTDSFQVVQITRALMGQGSVSILPAQYDWEVATESLFRHPRWNACHSLPLHAQMILTTLSFLELTAVADAEHPYAAWVSTEIGFAFKGNIQLLLSNRGGRPEVEPLVAFYRQLASVFSTTQPPKTMDEFNKRVRDLLPHDHHLDLLATAEARAQFCQDLVRLTETGEFIREAGQARRQWSLDGKMIDLHHVSSRPERVAQIESAKALNWQAPSLEDWLKPSLFLKRKGLQADKVLAAFPPELTPSDLLNGDADQLFAQLTQAKLLKAFCDATGLKPDRPFFKRGWEQFQEALQAEDKSGLLTLGWQTEPSDDPPLKRVGDLDERALRAYADKFWQDTFPHWPSPFVSIVDAGAIALEGPGIRVALQLDESVALFADAHNHIHLPMRHSAVIERTASRQ